MASCMGTSATVVDGNHLETQPAGPQRAGAVLLCDAAGHDAAQKAAERFLSAITASRSVRFATLSGAHDPASLMERPDGKAILEREIERAISAPMVLYRRRR